MKPFAFFKFLFVVLATSMFFTSCTDDGSGGTNLINPKLDFSAGTGVITSDATVNAGETFTVNLVATKGDNNMSTITIQEAGEKISDLTRLKYSHTTGSGNPLSLFDGNKSSFDIKVTVTAHTDISTKAYSFIVADEKGNSVTKSLNITTVGNPPTITKPTTALNFDIQTDALFTTEFNVIKGSANLTSVEVSINGVKATDLSRIFYGNLQTPFSANPQLIPAADQAALNKDILFRAPSSTGTYTYTVKFIDAIGMSASINLIASVGTKVNMLEGILLNQSGPTGQGGLDLDTGAGTGSADTKADIRDEGVVNVIDDGTWKQQISGVNGSVIKYIKKGQNGIAETFAFSNIKYKEEISPLWANGIAFNQKSTDDQRDVSAKVEKGDIFIVKNGEKYYLITVKDIKITPEPTGDDRNKDSYTFDVKF